MASITLISTGIIALFAIALLYAAFNDWRRYIISNRLVLVVTALYAVFFIAQYFSPSDSRLIPATTSYFLYSLLWAIAVFAVTCVFFYMGVMGGGDVKLMSAIALWAGPAHCLQFLLITAVAGGIVTLLVVLRHRLLPKSAEVLAAGEYPSQIVNHLSHKLTVVKIPYGLGISAGGLAVAYALANHTPRIF